MPKTQISRSRTPIKVKNLEEVGRSLAWDVNPIEQRTINKGIHTKKNTGCIAQSMPVKPVSNIFEGNDLLHIIATCLMLRHHAKEEGYTPGKNKKK